MRTSSANPSRRTSSSGLTSGGNGRQQVSLRGGEHGGLSAMRSGGLPSSSALARHGREPDPEDPHFVHEEIRQLASGVKNVIEKHFQRHGTSEAQIVNSVKQFGVSEQSKLMLAKEKAAAELAINQRIYGVWRNENARHAINRDYCSRIGPLHKCFCGHDLVSHNGGIIGRDRRGFPVAPKCSNCPCDGYKYIPNEPEEVGEHWLARRPGFVPGSWEAKCRCGHGSSSHEQGGRAARGACRACRSCSGFDGHFLCIVCDGKFADHVTLFETEEERKAAGKPIREEFIPLKDMDWEVQAIVFDGRLGSEQITGGGHAIRGISAGMAGGEMPRIGGQTNALLRPTSGGLSNLSASRVSKPLQPQLTSSPYQQEGTHTSSQRINEDHKRFDSFGSSPTYGQQRVGDRLNMRRPEHLGSESGGARGQHAGTTSLRGSESSLYGSGGGVVPSQPSASCASCGSAFRTSTSKFCSSCGAKR